MIIFHFDKQYVRNLMFKKILWPLIYLLTAPVLEARLFSHIIQKHFCCPVNLVCSFTYCQTNQVVQTKMVPWLKLPWTQAKSTKGSFWLFIRVSGKCTFLSNSNIHMGHSIFPLFRSKTYQKNKNFVNVQPWPLAYKQLLNKP